MSAYVEVDRKGSPPFSEPGQISSITEGSFSFGWEYEVFDALAFGRSEKVSTEGEDATLARRPLFAPRGMPSPCSLAVGRDYFRLVADPPNLPDRNFRPRRLCVSAARAANWLNHYRCHTATFLQWFNCEPTLRLWRVVSAPNHYNASWLQLAEFDQSLRHHGLELAALPVEYRILRSALSQLADQHGCDRVRLVIWFS